MAEGGSSATVIPLRDAQPGGGAARHSPDLVAFLFTDIEGSSLRWLNHRAAMQEVVREHDDILRATIVDNGGEVFKTGGDAFSAAFRRPAEALGAAVAAQRALNQREWSSVGGLKVRMAVHVGTAERRDGDFFGPALNRVARLLALGHGGQILVTASAAELLAAERENVHSLRLLGAHVLDDPLAPVAIHQVEGQGLPREFPPLRTVENRPTNLPRQVTALLGRQHEFERLCSLLVGSPLVTITGAGGVGKTRLALEAGIQLLDRFADGTWLAELAAITDPAMVPSAIASALGIDAATDQTPTTALVSRLRRQDLLLVLDNCEHVIDAVAKLVETLLSAAPDVRVVVTSQEPLGIAGEQVFRLPSLAVPEDTTVTAEDALHAGAVQLFVERARAADPRFTLDDRNAPTIAAICRRLDGIALAIEMAASRAPMLGVDKLAEKLDERFRVLTGGRRTALPRQQTLRATLDWSHGLLSDNERSILRRAAIFSGGFTLDAASAVIADAGLDEFEVVDQLSHLVARSLVVADTGEAGTRYRLLETTRAYALERLADAGETAACERRHAEYFRAFFDRGYAEWNTLSDWDWRSRYAPERDNLRNALDWAFGPAGDPVMGLALMGSAVRLWQHLSLFAEGRQRLEAALPHLDPATPAVDASRIWFSVGALWQDADVIRATAAFDRAVGICRSLGHSSALAEALLNVASQRISLGRQVETDAGLAALEEARPLVEKSGNPRLAARYHMASGFVAHLRNDLPSSVDAFMRAVDCARAFGAERVELVALSNLCDTRWAMGDLDVAIRDLREHVARVRQSRIAPRSELGNPLANLAAVLTEKGDLADALEIGREAFPLIREVGSYWYYLDPYALRVALSGRLEDAARLQAYTDAAFVTQGIDSRQPNEQRLRERTLVLLAAHFNASDLERLRMEGEKLGEEEVRRIALEL